MSKEDQGFVASHLPLICFSLFVLLSLIAMIWLQSKALNDLKERNDRILSHYEHILAVSPEPLIDEPIDLNPCFNEFKMTLTQRMALQNYTKKVVETAVAKSHVDLEVNSIVEAKATTMYQETKDLLEMQFAKIQHETESLQIWCGILTVVFLIFSFYSLFKTDELVKQGKEGVKELAELQVSGKNSIKEMKALGEQKIQSFEKESNSAIFQAGRRALFEKQKIEESVKQINEAANAEVDRRILETNTALDQKYLDLSSELQKIIREHDAKEERVVNEQIKQMRGALLNLNQRFEEIERQIAQKNG